MNLLTCAMLAAAIAAPACAQVGHASAGYVYFHRVGADAAQQHAALLDCVEKAKALRWVSPAVAKKKLADRMVADAFIVAAARRQVRANVENCMVAGGWEVVRLDDARGAALAASGPAELAAALASMIGAAAPEGQVVRRFAPVTDYFNGQFELDKDPSAPSLSLRADAEAEAAAAQAEQSSTPLTPATLLPVTPTPELGDGDAVIVVRATAESRGGFDMLLARADGDDGGAVTSYSLIQAYAHAPKRLLDPPHSQDQTFVYRVPPGRWRLISTGFLSFCLGAPAFDVAGGQVVFAGTFHGLAGGALAPDMALAPAQAALTAALARRLQPAAWFNGPAFPCAAKPHAFSYMFRLTFLAAPDHPPA